MAMGAPLTIWKHISLPLWRLVILCTSVLVTVLAFAAAVKFLADGKLGPVDTLRFMAFAAVPMLEYALPFAAGFAATMAYHRFAVDNEVMACQAGGMSYRRLLVPAAATGVGLLALLVYLSNGFIPAMLRSMQELAYQDITRVIVNSISKGEPVSIGGMLVTAERVESLGPDTSTGAYERLWLSGVTVVKLDAKTGEVEAEGTAKQAWVSFIRDDESNDSPANIAAGAAGPDTSSTLVVMKADKPQMFQEGHAMAEEDYRILSQRVPTPFRDDPQFKTWGQFREIRKTPELMAPVENLRRQLAIHLGERKTTARIDADLRAGKPAELIVGAQDAFFIRAGGIEWDGQLKWWRLLPRDGGITVERRFKGDRVQQLRARSGLLRTLTDPDNSAGEISVELRLETVAVTGASTEPMARQGSVAPGEHPKLEFRGLSLRENPVPAMLALSSAKLLEIADDHVRTDTNPYIVQPRDNLRNRIARLMREITSKEHSRVAIAVSCLVMILTGSVMAMRLKESLPLAVYLWSFLPALTCVLMILCGQKMAHAHGWIGLPILWSGVIGLGMYTAAEYTRLAQR